MRRIRPHLSYANVISTLCLFLLLTGGTAVALNGSNTVQSDDLGPGSQVKAPDVAANAVNGSDVVDNSLTGADVNESTLGKAPNADKLDGKDSTAFIVGRKLNRDLDRGDPVTPVVTVGPYEISGECVDAGTTGSLTAVRIYAKGPAGLSEAVFSAVDNDASDLGNFSRAETLSANVDTVVTSFLSPSSGFTRGAGTIVLRSNSSGVVQLDFIALAWEDAGVCHVSGTATTGT